MTRVPVGLPPYPGDLSVGSLPRRQFRTRTPPSMRRSTVSPERASAGADPARMSAAPAVLCEDLYIHAKCPYITAPPSIKKTALDRAIGNDGVNGNTLAKISREFVTTLRLMRKDVSG